MGRVGITVTVQLDPESPLSDLATIFARLMCLDRSRHRRMTAWTRV